MKLPTNFPFVLLFLILCSQSLFASDWEYWSNYRFNTKLTDKIDLKIAPQFRLKSKFGHFYYNKTYIGPVFKLSKFVKISPLYAYKTTEKNNHWKDENIGNLDIKLKLLNSFLNYRCRLEYNFTKDEWVNRNRFKLSKDYKKVKDLSFFVWDEVFYNFTSDKLDENRTAVGFSKTINENLIFGLSYILRYRKSNDWYSANILQTDLKIKF